MELNKDSIVLKGMSVRKTKIALWLAVSVISITLVSCTISYKFNGSSIDYSKTKDNINL